MLGGGGDLRGRCRGDVTPEAMAAVCEKLLPGFGEQKARIFVALLGKQLGIQPPGWKKAAAPFGDSGTFRSVADIDSPESLAKVRQYKQRMKARARAAASAPG